MITRISLIVALLLSCGGVFASAAEKLNWNSETGDIDSTIFKLSPSMNFNIKDKWISVRGTVLFFPNCVSNYFINDNGNNVSVYGERESSVVPNGSLTIFIQPIDREHEYILSFDPKTLMPHSFAIRVITGERRSIVHDLAIDEYCKESIKESIQ